MALDHSGLDYTWKTNSWKTNQAEFFAFEKFTLQHLAKQIRGCVNQPFILFAHHIWGETVLFIIQTSDRMQYFTIFQDKLHLVNIQDDQLWVFSKTVQKISKITYTGNQFSLLTSAKFAVNINRLVMLQHK